MHRLFALTFTLAPCFLAAAPPFQTAVQKTVRDARVKDAHILSNASYPKILQLLDTAAVRNGMSCLGGIAKEASSSLIEMLWKEIHLAHIVHNIPMSQFELMANSTTPSLRSRAPFPVIQKLGYVPSVWEEIAEKLLTYEAKYRYLEKVETSLFGFPVLDPANIQFPAAYDRPVYAAVNTWKRSVGDPTYGPIALVLDTTHTEDKIFLAPMDTGEYSYKCIKGGNESFRGRARTDVNCSAWKGDIYGSLSYFYHLVIPHLNFWEVTLDQLYVRWYGKTGCTKRPPVLFPYFEAEIAGAWLIPESLLMVTLDFDQLFGNQQGLNVQKWVKGLKRPLAWGSAADVGTIFDPEVNNLAGTYIPTQTDVDEFNTTWHSKGNFSAMYYALTHKLQLHFISAETAHKCSSCTSNCRPLGTNRDLDCMYMIPH